MNTIVKSNTQVNIHFNFLGCFRPILLTINADTVVSFYQAMKGMCMIDRLNLGKCLRHPAMRTKMLESKMFIH